MGFPDVSACSPNVFGVCLDSGVDARKDDLLEAPLLIAQGAGGQPPQGPGGGVSVPNAQGIGDLRLLPGSTANPGSMFINMARLALPSSGFGLLRQAGSVISGAQVSGADKPRPMREMPQRLGVDLLAAYKGFQQAWAAVTNRPGLSPELRTQLITFGSGAVEGMRVQVPALQAAVQQASQGRATGGADGLGGIGEVLVTAEAYRVGLSTVTSVLGQARDLAAAGNTQGADDILAMLASQMTRDALSVAARQTGERAQRLVAASEQGNLSPHFQSAVSDINVAAYGLRLALSDEMAIPQAPIELDETTADVVADHSRLQALRPDPDAFKPADAAKLILLTGVGAAIAHGEELVAAQPQQRVAVVADNSAQKLEGKMPPLDAHVAHKVAGTVVSAPSSLNEQKQPVLSRDDLTKVSGSPTPDIAQIGLFGAALLTAAMLWPPLRVMLAVFGIGQASDKPPRA